MVGSMEVERLRRRQLREAEKDRELQRELRAMGSDDLRMSLTSRHALANMYGGGGRGRQRYYSPKTQAQPQMRQPEEETRYDRSRQIYRDRHNRNLLPGGAEAVKPGNTYAERRQQLASRQREEQLQRDYNAAVAAVQRNQAGQGSGGRGAQPIGPFFPQAYPRGVGPPPTAADFYRRSSFGPMGVISQ